MRSLPIGFISILMVIMYAVGDNANWLLYLNLHSIVLVLGGTLSVLFFATPWKVLRSVKHNLLALLSEELTLAVLSYDLRELSKSKKLAIKSKEPLLNRAAELWEQGVSSDLFLALLNQTKLDLDQESIDSIQALRNLSKYPPALGMTGTVMGLVSLFANLTQENKSAIGPSLALAMTATFFGLIVSNMIVTPLADRLQVKQMRQRRYLSSLYQILTLIHQGEAELLIDEEILTAGGNHELAA